MTPWKPCPGNPYARQTAALRKAMTDAVSAQDIADIVAVLKLKASCGNMEAARLLFTHCVGTAGKTADPDTLDAHELGVRRASVASVEDMKAVFERMPASMMCELAAAVSPQVRQHMEEAFAGGVRRQGETEERGKALVPDKAGPYMATKADWAPEWLREKRGIPDELALTLEACPAYTPDYIGIDKVGHVYADMLRDMREGLLEGLGVKDGSRCRLVTAADDKRGKPAQAVTERGKPGGSSAEANGTAGGVPSGCGSSFRRSV